MSGILVDDTTKHEMSELIHSVQDLLIAISEIRDTNEQPTDADRERIAPIHQQIHDHAMRYAVAYARLDAAAGIEQPAPTL